MNANRVKLAAALHVDVAFAFGGGGVCERSVECGCGSVATHIRSRILGVRGKVRPHTDQRTLCGPDIGSRG